jgi:hypothetical protein
MCAGRVAMGPMGEDGYSLCEVFEVGASQAAVLCFAQAKAYLHQLRNQARFVC